MTDYFRRQFKRLSKNDLLLKKHFGVALASYQKHTSIAIGSNVYKFRVAGKGKGKSGGYRVYCLLLEFDVILVPVTIYAKSEQEALSREELIHHVRAVRMELRLTHGLPL